MHSPAVNPSHRVPRPSRGLQPARRYAHRSIESVFHFVPALRRNYLILFAFHWLPGCAAPQGELFPRLETGLVFPPPPDIPRIRWLGELRDSGDLKAARSGVEVFQAAMRGPLPPIPFSSPHGLTLREGRYLAVADGTGGVVHLIDLVDRSHRMISGFDKERFGSPMGVVWMGHQLYVTDAARREVIVLHDDGSLAQRFGAQELVRPVGIAFAASINRLFVVDSGAHRIGSFAPNGGDVQWLGERGSGLGQFNFPTHIVVAGDHLWVADTGNFRVQMLNLDGHSLNMFGQKGDAAGDLSLPKGLAVDRGGHVYVVDAHFENVQIFDPEGRLLMAFGEPGVGRGQFSLPAGLTIDEQDRIWVADAGNHRIQVFEYLRTSS